MTVEFVGTDAMGRRSEGSWTVTTDGHGAATLANAEGPDASTESIWYGMGGAGMDDTSPLEMLLHQLSPAGLFPSPPRSSPVSSTRSMLRFAPTRGCSAILPLAAPSPECTSVPASRGGR